MISSTDYQYQTEAKWRDLWVSYTPPTVGKSSANTRTTCIACQSLIKKMAERQGHDTRRGLERYPSPVYKNAG